MKHIKNPHDLTCLIGKTIKEIKCIEDSCYGTLEHEVTYLFEATDGTRAKITFTKDHCCA